MISVTLREDEARLVRLCLALTLNSLLNNEALSLKTMCESFRDAGVDGGQNPLANYPAEDLSDLIKKFGAPHVQDQDGTAAGTAAGPAGPG